MLGAESFADRMFGPRDRPEGVRPALPRPYLWMSTFPHIPEHLPSDTLECAWITQRYL